MRNQKQAFQRSLHLLGSVLELGAPLDEGLEMAVHLAETRRLQQFWREIAIQAREGRSLEEALETCLGRGAGALPALLELGSAHGELPRALILAAGEERFDPLRAREANAPPADEEPLPGPAPLVLLGERLLEEAFRHEAEALGLFVPARPAGPPAESPAAADLPPELLPSAPAAPQVARSRQREPEPEDDFLPEPKRRRERAPSYLDLIKTIHQPAAATAAPEPEPPPPAEPPPPPPPIRAGPSPGAGEPFDPAGLAGDEVAIGHRKDGRWRSPLALPAHIVPDLMRRYLYLARIPYWTRNPARGCFAVEWDGREYPLEVEYTPNGERRSLVIELEGGS